MTFQPTLQTERLILRPFALSDAPAVQQLAGAAEIADTTLNIPHPYEDGMAEEWISTHAPGFAAGKLATFAVTDLGGVLVGAVGLRLELAHQRAELGYWIAVPSWNRGYATEAVAALITFGFGELGLNRIHATHLVRNPASGKVMRKVGMSYEGCHRQHIIKHGRFEDQERFAILSTDSR